MRSNVEGYVERLRMFVPRRRPRKLIAIKYRKSLSPPVAWLGEEDYSLLSGMEGGQVITCNTIRHITNAIDVSDLIVTNLAKYKFAKAYKK